ncbi:MAG: tRNA glutamyl-Q(34) synthetase GluQRS [Rubripirellula sp.]|nr:tRNA glutamyl-Q(34) synthetase GluQRS [Rubripirellula sp.]
MAGRFAPSPTGAQHLGNARTYLLAYWSAKQRGQRLIFRVEDVDSPRVKPWAVQQSLDDLLWLGLTWDEGPDREGAVGPYLQTQRMSIYKRVLQDLIAENRVYPCCCTRKDIQNAGSAPHFDHEPAIYPGTCAGWKHGMPLPEAGTYCWRFRSSEKVFEFDDRVLGLQVTRPSETLGDFPVTQKNGEPSYQLAVTVDDSEMGITEVVRGNDLVASTFRQLQIFEFLNATPPTYAHVPLVLGKDGRRLAKRHGDTRLSTLRSSGVAPEQIVTWAAHSAGLIGSDKKVAHVDEVVPRFSWLNLQRDDVVLEDDWSN